MRKLVLFTSIISFTFLGCKSIETSQTDVIGGIDQNGYPAVVLLEIMAEYKENEEMKQTPVVCAGTFVSKTTVLTAAQCVYEGENYKTLSVKAHGIDATKWIKHPSYKLVKNTTNVSESYASTDVAVVIFPDNTAPSTLNIATQQPRRRDQVTVVGFGCNDLKNIKAKAEEAQRLLDAARRQGRSQLNESEKQMVANMPSCTGDGQKRSGTNIIDSVGSVIQLSSNLQTTANEVSTGNGDAGAPLFVNNRIVGINSTNTFGTQFFTGAINSNTSHFANIFNATNISFFKSTASSGADIPGITSAANNNDSSNTKNDSFLLGINRGEGGVVAGSVRSGSVASKLGLTSGSVITAIDSVTITSMETFLNQWRTKRVGDAVSIKIRGNQQLANYNIQSSDQNGSSISFGIDNAYYFVMQVASLNNGSRAATMGLKVGDYITHVDNQRLSTFDNFSTIWNSKKSGVGIKWDVVRRNSSTGRLEPVAWTTTIP